MRRNTACLLGLAIVLFFAAGMRGEEPPKYTNESFARLSFVEGSVAVQRAPDAKPEEGVLNTPLEDGNIVSTAGGRAEVYFGKSNFARLDNNSGLEIMSLPKKDSNQVRLRVQKGSVYLSVFNLDQEKSIEVHSADASFYVLGEGLYRIDVQEKKKTDILVFNGMIEAAGEEGSQLLKSEQSLEASQGRFGSKPRRFFAVAEDGFDRWNESRDTKAMAFMAQGGNLPEELKDFGGELEEYGDWVYVRPHGWVWAPKNVGEDWRPYSNGSWVDLSIGMTWLPYEPWGWAPFHYGRWGWGAGIGWYWMPTSIWGPAWVSWGWGYDYWAWAPMSWYGYPGYLYGGVYYDHWDGDYPSHSRALTVVHKDQLRAKNVSRAALNSSTAKGLDKMTMTAQAPSVRSSQSGTVARSLAADGKVFPRREGQAGTGRLAGVNSRLGSSAMRGASPSGQAGQAERGRLTGPAQSGSQVGRSGAERRSRIEGAVTGGPSRRTEFGYPSSPNVSVRKFNTNTAGSRSSSIRSRFYDYLQGNRSSSRDSSMSRGSGSSRGSTTSRSRGSISSGSRGSSSGSRGSVSSGSRGSSSSGSRGSSSGPRGGSVSSRGSSGGGSRGRH
jgi:hypothetical protein